MARRALGSFVSALALLFVIAYPVHAAPLTWHFSGTASSSSEFNSMPIGGLDFELRFFLDTDLVPFMGNPSFPDIMFIGPHQGEVEIETLGVVPVNAANKVEYHSPGGLGNPVTAVHFYAPSPHFIMFASPILSDSSHLAPVPPTAPTNGALSMFFPLQGPNGLSLSGPVTIFSATLSATAVPEGGSTALLFTSALVAFGLLKRRYQDSAS